MLPPARWGLQGNRSACRLSAARNRVPCDADSDTANAAVTKQGILKFYPYLVLLIFDKPALTDSWAGRADPHAQQIMNSHISKKSAPIWIFCCLRATCSSLGSRFAKTNIKMGSFLQYIYMIKNGSSQVMNFYVILGTITCTAYGFLTIFRLAVPI